MPETGETLHAPGAFAFTHPELFSVPVGSVLHRYRAGDAVGCGSDGKFMKSRSGPLDLGSCRSRPSFTPGHSSVPRLGAMRRTASTAAKLLDRLPTPDFPPLLRSVCYSPLCGEMRAVFFPILLCGRAHRYRSLVQRARKPGRLLPQIVPQEHFQKPRWPGTVPSIRVERSLGPSLGGLVYALSKGPLSRLYHGDVSRGGGQLFVHCKSSCAPKAAAAGAVSHSSPYWRGFTISGNVKSSLGSISAGSVRGAARRGRWLCFRFMRVKFLEDRTLGVLGPLCAASPAIGAGQHGDPDRAPRARGSRSAG